MIATSPLGPTLTTERLILRPPVPEDFEDFVAFCADPVVTEFIGGVMSRAIAWRSLRTMAGSWALDGFHMFSVLNRVTGEWMGRIGPLYPDGWPGREVGWGLMRPWWGQGYAAEASLACMDFVFDSLGWRDVIHTIAPNNVGSQGVARKLGSVNRGPGKLPDPYAGHPVELWGQTRDAWQVNRRKLLSLRSS